MRPRIRFRHWSLAIIPMLALATVVLRLGIADLLVDRDPEAALRWWPWHGAARLRLAIQSAEAGNHARAQLEARTLLSCSPLAGTAYRVLARLYEQRGETSGAFRHYRIAARRAPRDRPTRIWLINHFTARGDFRAAMAHVDQLLRVAPGQLPETLPLLSSFTATPEARAALLHVLGDQAPPWRRSFLVWLAQQPDTLPVLAAVFSPLRTAPVPLDSVERNAWIERLQREGRIAEAQYLWIEAQPAERRRMLGNVFDGGFELPPDNAGFGWVFQDVPGATIHREPGAGVSGAHALVIDFHDRRVPFAHVQQRLALPPGRYAMRGRVRLDGLRNERGLHWRVRCDDGRILGESQTFQGSSAWREFRFEFERPADACDGQVLLLRLDARIAPEQMIGGRVWFDDLQIQLIDH